MSKLWTWLSGLLGNSPKVVILIGIFLLVMIFFAARCSPAAEVHLGGGVSFGCLRYAPVLTLDVVTPLGEGFGWDVGTNLWGKADAIRNNFDFHARVEFSRGAFGAAIGPAVLQNIDAVDGSRVNFTLMLFWRPWRVGAEVIHISNGGTSEHNCGRNAALADVRLR